MTTKFTEEELAAMSEEKLDRKENQAWDMAGLARRDGDLKDAEIHASDAQACVAELRRRRGL